MSDITEQAVVFDSAHAVDVYRDILTQQNRSRSPDMQNVFGDIAARLRRIWLAETGVDNLHESAIGEPLAS